MALTAPELKPAADAKPRRVTILGATGSVGCNTLDLIQRAPERYSVEALTAHRSVDKLAAAARGCGAAIAVIAEPSLYGDLKRALSGSGIEAAAGDSGLAEAAARPAEWVMAAIVGAAGLRPTLAAARRGAVVALANKECLVSAGEVVLAEVRRSGATLLPVDSEHNAIFQVFDFERPEAVDRIILTASGGPFRSLDLAGMAGATPEQAIAHPNWDMGAKISVDSATMMNKGLELIEAAHLFPLPAERIDILIHPQSVVHSLVSYIDGSVLAQLGTPDMRTPIAYTLAWPERMRTPAARLDLVQIGKLTFEPPDLERFPALALARSAQAQGGGAPTVLNAANEVAVEAFLARRIGFLDIIRIVAEVLERLPAARPASLDDVIELDRQARRVALETAGLGHDVPAGR